MLPIVSVVGASGSGKTTFLEKLIPELVRHGYRVGALKHDAHGFQMDKEGKDTWRHRKAGAHVIGISSRLQVATIRSTEEEMDLQELAGRYFWLEDILITEGFKTSHYPKIEVFRAEVAAKPQCGKKDNLIAVLSDDRIELDVPQFNFGEIAAIADLIEDRFLKERKNRRIAVFLDGKNLPMNRFVSDFLTRAIHGMLSSLKGWSSPHRIDIQIRLEDE
ncbi:MAG: molybdopterin-guanine dinucleotide biosynthesis protein B [Syntrophobacteraceae bacterium]